MRYGSVCSGIEAATVAWDPLGWRPSFFSEIEKFPRAVLAHHYPKVPCHGDFTTIKAGEYDPIDVLVGGTPCQSFSVAGLRGGLADERGNLALEYLRLAQRLRPGWVVWENVPGVLSSNGGRDFGAVLGGLVELGYGVAYRVLDAQFFGVPQRRRRVFVVGYLGDWRPAAAVLFERHSLQGHSPPRRSTGKGVAPTISSRPTGGGGLGTDFDLDGGLIAGALKASLSSTQCPNEDATLIVTDDVSVCLNGGKMARNDPGTETFISVVRNGNAKQWPAEVAPTLNAAFADKQGLEDQHALNGGGLFVPSQRCSFDVAHALRAEGFDASEDGTGRGTPLVPVAFALQERAGCENPNAGPDGAGYREGTAYTLEARQTPQSVAFAMRGREGGAMPEMSGDNVSALRAASGGSTRDFLAFTQNQRDEIREVGVAGALAAEPGMKQQTFVQTSAVRRLTPRECERLQGFPDDYTLITHRKKPSADGPRYKALGNSMAVPVMRWIGERIQMVEDMRR